MRTILKLLILSIFFASCGSGKNNFKTSEDNAFTQAIKKLNKSPENQELKTALASLYNEASKLHLDKIEIYKTLTEPDRFDKIIGEYEVMQQLHSIVQESDVAKRIVQSKDYSADIVAVKEQGAMAYYDRGLSQLSEGNRKAAKAAYLDFKKVNKLVPGFRDVKLQMAEAYESSIINVVINQIRTNRFYYNTGSNSYNNYSAENFQRNLVRELGGDFHSSIPARFYNRF